MADNIEQNLDLAKILATLANLPQPEAQSYQEQKNEYDSTQSYQVHELNPQPDPIEHGVPYHYPSDPRLVGRPASQHHQPAPRPQDRVKTPFVDPSTITEWKQGLRCVSKIAFQNPEFVPAVRKVLPNMSS